MGKKHRKLSYKPWVQVPFQSLLKCLTLGKSTSLVLGFLFFEIFIGVWLLCHVVLASAAQRNESAIHIQISPLFGTSLLLMHPSVHCSTIYNSQDMETTWMSIDRGMVLGFLVCKWRKPSSAVRSQITKISGLCTFFLVFSDWWLSCG